MTATTRISIPLIRPASNEQDPGKWIYIPSPTNPTLVASQRPPSMGIHSPSDDMVMGLSTDSALSTRTYLETSPEISLADSAANRKFVSPASTIRPDPY